MKMWGGWYKLKGKEPVPVDTVEEWSAWYEGSRADRIIAHTDFPEWGVRKMKLMSRMHKQQPRVSTVFLGLDHSWEVDTKPILFETLIFGGKKHKDDWDGLMWRYPYMGSGGGRP